MKWEYMKRWGSPWLDVQTLNELGADRWELCGIVPAGAHFDSVWLIFKRPLP